MTRAGDGAAPEPAWVGEVITFWLDETPPESRFKRSDALDQAVIERFRDLYERLHAAPPGTANLNPRLALAAVIVLDQFSRNMFRNSPEAFASDSQARTIAKAAVGAGLDRQLERDGRLFLYLPFEHSEDLVDQERAVALISALGDPELTRYAEAHRDIVRRFGRFPHRNGALGRDTTAAEAAFLREPGSSF